MVVLILILLLQFSILQIGIRNSDADGVGDVEVDGLSILILQFSALQVRIRRDVEVGGDVEVNVVLVLILLLQCSVLQVRRRGVNVDEDIRQIKGIGDLGQSVVRVRLLRRHGSEEVRRLLFLHQDRLISRSLLEPLW